jgi:hypothetical protein
MREEIPWEKARAVSSGADGYHLIIEPGAFRHRGIDLSFVVEGLSELGLEEGFRLHPDDLEELGVKAGAQVTLSVNGLKVSGAAKAEADCPRGMVYVHRPSAYGGIPHRRSLEPLYNLKASPIKVTLGHEGKPPDRERQERNPAGRSPDREG